MCRTFLPDTESKPESMHSVRPVPWGERRDQDEEVREEWWTHEHDNVVFLVHGSRNGVVESVSKASVARVADWLMPVDAILDISTAPQE